MGQSQIELVAAVLSLAGSVISFLKALLTRPEGSGAKAAGVGLLLAVLAVLSFYFYWNRIDILQSAQAEWDEYFGPPRYLAPVDVHPYAKKGQLILISPALGGGGIKIQPGHSTQFRARQGTFRIRYLSGDASSCQKTYRRYAPPAGDLSLSVESCEGGNVILYVERVDRGLTFVPD